jgi:UDP-glucose 4-epimerase
MDLAEDFYTAIKGVENQVGMQITNLGSDQSYKLLEMIFNREKSTEKNISA